MTTEQERLFSQSLKKIELVCWSGTADALAFRLGLPVARVIEAVGRMRNERRPGAIKIEINLARTAPIFEATRRALLNDADGEAGRGVLRLPEHGR